VVAQPERQNLPIVHPERAFEDLPAHRHAHFVPEPTPGGEVRFRRIDEDSVHVKDRAQGSSRHLSPSFAIFPFFSDSSLLSPMQPIHSDPAA
jgi:hypothetical protein